MTFTMTCASDAPGTSGASGSSQLPPPPPPPSTSTSGNKAVMLQPISNGSMGELTFLLRSSCQTEQGRLINMIRTCMYAEMLKKFDLVNVKSAITPMEPSCLLTKVLLGVEKSDARSTWAWKRKCQGHLILMNWCMLYSQSTYLRFSCQQFWQTATARTLADGTQQLDATIDTIEYTITEESVRGWQPISRCFRNSHMLQNEEIFAGLQNIGSKSGGWDQFGSNIAIALICQPQPSADPTPSQSVPATSSSHVQITQPPPTVTHSVQPPHITIKKGSKEKGKEPLTEVDLSSLKFKHQRHQNRAFKTKRLVEQEEETAREALATEFDYIQARLNADQILAEKIQQEEREHISIEERAKFLLHTIAAKGKHDELMSKSFEEIQSRRKKGESVHEEVHEEERSKEKEVRHKEDKNQVCLLCEAILKQIPAFNFFCASLESITAIEKLGKWEKVWEDIPTLYLGFVWAGKMEFGEIWDYQLCAIWKNLGYSEWSTPTGLKLARENLQSRVKEEDSITDVENAVFDLGVMDSLCFLFVDQRVFIGMITKFIKFIELNFSVITRGFDIKVGMLKPVSFVLELNRKMTCLPVH
ncbi:hypothetical protein Tco_1174751 [Tanacetum coccineum]